MIPVNQIICKEGFLGLKNLPDNCISLILTDPPYNCGKDYGENKDKLKQGDYEDWAEELIREFKRVAAGNIVLILGSQPKILLPWWNQIPEAKLICVRMGAISNNFVKGLSCQFHPILTTVKANRYMPDLWDDIRWPGEGYFFNEPRYGHPAMTPLKLAKRCIDLFCPEGGLVYDPFMGVGTVAVAAKHLQRNFAGTELNPKFIEIAEARLDQGVLQL